MTTTTITPEQDNEIRQNLRNYCHTFLGDVAPESPAHHDYNYFLRLIDMYPTVQEFIKDRQDVIDFLESDVNPMPRDHDILNFAQKQITTRLLWNRFKSGETLHMRNPRTGLVFDIKPEYSDLMPTIVIGYSFLVNGKVERGHNRIMLDRDNMLDCLFQNEEVQA